MLRCSHVICRVDDVGALVRDYGELGFTVEWGSAPAKAHNAFVRFERGPFLEFFELAPGAARWRWPVGLVFGAAAGERLARWARPGEGCRDLAVETESTSLADTRTALRAAGLQTSRVLRGRRTRPDGELVRYEFLATHPPELPFVVSAYDPPQRPASIRHPNGARGVERVHFAVTDADRPALATLLADDSHLSVVAARGAGEGGVLGVEIAGLDHDLDPARLHGVALTRTADPTREGHA